MNTSNDNTSKKKAKTRHVIKFRDWGWEIDEDDFNVLNCLTAEDVDSWLRSENPKYLIDDGHVRLGDTSKGDRRVTRIRVSNRLYFDGILSYIQRFDALECLSLEDTPIKDLPENLDRLDLLKELSLINCRELENFPLVLEKMTFLKVLDLRDCTSLEKLSDGIGKMDGLEILRLSITDLDELPTSIGHLTNLKELDLEGTHKTECGRLTPSLSKLHNLEFLRITSCTFSRFPSDFGTKCSKIKALHLEWTNDDVSEGDKAFSIIQKIRQMDSLEKAHVYAGDDIGDRIQLPESSILSAFGQLNNLKELSLSLVMVCLIDLDGQHSLEELTLENCFVEMSGADGGRDARACTMDSLRILQMIDCDIWFDLSSLHCSKLEDLSIDYIGYLPREHNENLYVQIHRLEHFPNLQKVFIADPSNNPTTFIELESLSKFTKVKQLELYDVLPWIGEIGERMIIKFPYLRHLEIEIYDRCLSTDCSIPSLFKMIEFPVLQSYSIVGNGRDGRGARMSSDDFEEICSEIFSKNSNLELAGFPHNQISAISEATISSLPFTLKVLDMSGNPIVCDKQPYESSIEIFSKILDHCPELGYIGFSEKLIDPSGKIGHKMSINRARSRVLASQKIPTALWPRILSNAPVAFKYYQGIHGDNSSEWKEHEKFQGIKEPADSIFHLLRQRAARDMFFPME